MITRQTVSVLVVIALLLGAGIYFVQQSGTPEPDSTEVNWQTAPATTAITAQTTSDTGKVGALSQMVVKLEQRLHQEGGTADDWLLLGKTYQYLGRIEDADKAYSKAREMGYDPAKLDNARAAMTQQLASSAPRIAPPNNKMSSLELVALDQVLAAKGSKTETSMINGTLTLSPALRSQVPASATLFIYARDAEQAGSAPFAVIRTQDVKFPISFQLNDSHAVVPGRTLSSASTVVIGARLTVSGNASGQQGDFEGLSRPVDITKNAPVVLEINQIRQ